MRRLFVGWTALLLLGLTIGGCAQILLLDGLAGAILPVFYGDDTIYARRYSDTNFRRVTVGMTPTEVTALLGPPLREVREYEHRASRPESDSRPPSLAVWSFTRTANDSSYRVRVVRFWNGFVETILHEYYLD